MPVVFYILLVLLISACALEPLPADNASAGKLSLTQPVTGTLLKDETLPIEDSDEVEVPIEAEAPTTPDAETKITIDEILAEDNTTLAMVVPEAPISEPPAPAPQPPEPEPEPVLLEPIELIGLAQDDLTRRIGKPDYRRREGQSTVLQFRLKRCVLDFVILDAGANAVVATWHGRHRQGGMTYNHDHCVADLTEQAQIQP